jgi:hypothetical protein
MTKFAVTINSIDKQIAALEKQRQEVIAAIEPLQAKASRIYNKAAKLQTQKDKNVDWAWLLEVYPESTVKYEFRREQFRKLGLMDPFGHWMDTKQTAVKIGLNKQDSKTSFWRNDKQLAAVKKLLPFIKYGEKGCKRIDIFEHTLSKGSCYWLEFYKDGRIQLAASYSKPVKFKSIEEAFKYVRDNHWYESDDPCDNDRREYDEE